MTFALHFVTAAVSVRIFLLCDEVSIDIMVRSEQGASSGASFLVLVHD